MPPVVTQTISEARLASHAGLAVARTGIDALGSFALVAVIARGLGAEALGAYVYAATVGALVYALGSLSVTAIVVREVARRPENVRSLASIGFQLRAFLVLPANAALIGLLALALPMTDETRAVTALLGVAVGFGFVTDLAFGLFQSTGRFEAPLGITAVYKVATIAVAVALVSSGGAIVPLAIAVVGLQAVQALLALLLVRAIVTPLDWRPRPSAWWRLGRESTPLALSSFADTISNRADVLILGLLRSVGEVGIYGAAYNLYIGAAVLVAAMQAALLPAFSRASEAALRPLWLRSASAVLVLGTLAGAVFLFGGGPLVRIFYGGALAAAAEPLRILGPVTLVFVTERLLLTTLISRGHQRAVLYALVPGGLLNLLFNAAVVPRYGYNGAAASTLASEVIVLLIAMILMWRKVPALRPRIASA